MCLIVLAWRARSDLPLVVAANRDEWRDRPAQPAHWMGLTADGRFAAVTNFRDPADKRSTARSRGALVTGFLSSSVTPRAYCEQLLPHVRDYNGFNLILGDADALFYFGSRE